jgi:4a-hydroxytetrahydrobiopterin dehydratase
MSPTVNQDLLSLKEQVGIVRPRRAKVPDWTGLGSLGRDEVGDVPQAVRGGKRITLGGLPPVGAGERGMKLDQKHCAPVTARTPPVLRSVARRLMKGVPKWVLARGEIHREFKFRNFREALRFVNRVGSLAESEGHHPDILIHSWNRVRLSLHTHAIHALSENDFILAARIDRIAPST